jgi:hypothetical protein
MNKKDATILGVIGILFVGLLLYVFWDKNTAPTITPPQTTTTTLRSTSTPEAATTTSKTKKNIPTKTTSPGAATPQYTAALNTYRNLGYYFQFSNCSATPGTLTVKKGAKFMIDNRDAKTHRITVGSRTITVAGYGFYVLSAEKIGTNQITCDGGGAGVLTVQK